MKNINTAKSPPPSKIDLKPADEVDEFAENIINTIREPLLVLDDELRVIKASRSFYNFFKVKPENTIERLIYELGNHQWDIPKLRELLENILPEKTTFDNYEVEHNFSSIGKRIMLLNARQIKRGLGKERIILLAIEDVTERKREERSLSEKSRLNTEYLNILLNHAHAPIITWDSSLRIKRFNPEFEKLSGYNKSEVQDKKIEILFPKNEVDTMLELIKNNINDENSEVIEVNILTKDKEIKTVLWNSANISDEEGKNTVATIAQDITERKHDEHELINAKNKAEESDRLKSAFLANMSHEIRTPMNGILGFTELLKEPMLSGEQQQEYIDIIQKSGNRMLNIINDIISISRIESDQIKITISDSNINEQLGYIYMFFKPEAEQKQLHLSFRSSLAGNESIVKTDKGKVYAVLTNLVKNALKFTQKGSIELGCDKKGEFLEFYIKDSGKGVRKDQQEIIFERFRQDSESLTRNYEGAGLGLAISKTYVEMLGGEIRVESNSDLNPTNGDPGKTGSTFFFTIPINHGQEAKIAPEITLTDDATKIHVMKLKILVAEDDDISGKLITNIIDKFADKPIKVTTGIEAVNACRNNPDIDLVLMDIKMPDMDGYEAIRQIRGFNKDVVIIAQTAYAFSGDKKKAIAAGCNSCITKPINMTLLYELIRKHFYK